ncbi:MAG: amidohydrolase family protein [Candidatus Bathyarchaeia archaeon]
MSFDILIRDGRVVDGTGNPWFRADVGIKEGKIAAVGHLGSAKADRVIEASGLIVCPGFIDIHNHSDTTPLTNRNCESFVRQGVTTQVIGNCGTSAAPISEEYRHIVEARTNNLDIVRLDWNTFDQYLRRMDGVATNIVPQVGNGTLRIAVMGYEMRAPTKRELREMKQLLTGALEDGVFGMSFGPYPPAGYADTEELIDLAEVVAMYGGIFSTHIRGDSATTFIPAVREAIEIGERSGCPVQISHHASLYDAWGQNQQSLRLIEEAQGRGVDVTCDLHTYVYAAAGLTTLLPDWAHEGGPEKILERVSDPETREKMREFVLAEEKSYTHRSIAADGLWDKIRISRSRSSPGNEGKSLEKIGKERGTDPWTTVYDLLQEEGPPYQGIISKAYREDEVRRAIESPYSMVSSDGRSVAPYGPLGVGKPHPRYYGTFPSLFRKYVRGETRRELLGDEGARILTLEEAVRKSTSMPAQKLGLLDRGVIRENAWADVVVFNADTITDKATFVKPHQYPEGIAYVLVNGVVVIDEGEHTGALPGRTLRGPGYRKR